MGFFINFTKYLYNKNNNFIYKFIKRFLNKRKRNLVVRNFFNVKRGQTWSFDLIMAVLLFVVVMGLFYGFLAKDSSNQKNDLQYTNDILVYQLNCDNQESSNYCVLENGELIDEKINELYDEDYQTLKLSLGINEDFCIYLRDTNGNLIPFNSKTSIGSSDLSLNENTSCGDYVEGYIPQDDYQLD
jgi:hypothetical protein